MQIQTNNAGLKSVVIAGKTLAITLEMANKISPSEINCEFYGSELDVDFDINLFESKGIDSSHLKSLLVLSKEFTV